MKTNEFSLCGKINLVDYNTLEVIDINKQIPIYNLVKDSLDYSKIEEDISTKLQGDLIRFMYNHYDNYIDCYKDEDAFIKSTLNIEDDHIVINLNSKFDIGRKDIEHILYYLNVRMDCIFSELTAMGDYAFDMKEPLTLS